MMMNKQPPQQPASLWKRTRDALSGIPTAVWFLLASAFFAGMGLRLNWLFLNFHLENIGFGRDLIGYANAVPALSMVIIGIPAGIYAPRVGYVRSLRLAGALAAVSLLLVASALSPLLVFVGLFGFGVGNSLIMATMPPLLQYVAPIEKRVIAFSLYGAVGTMAGFLGSIAGGYLPNLLGGVDGVIYLMSAVFGLSLIPLFGLQKLQNHERKPFKMRHPRRWAKLLIPNTVIAFGAGAVMPFLNLYLADKFGLSFEWIGFIFGISALSTTVVMLLQPLLVNAWGKVGAIIASQTAALPFILVIAYVPLLPLVTVAMFVREALMNAANPIYTALAMQLLADEEAAAYMIAMNASWRIAWAISSSISGELQYALGVQAFDYLFAAMLTLYSVAIFLTWRFFWEERAQIEADALAPVSI